MAIFKKISELSVDEQRQIVGGVAAGSCYCSCSCNCSCSGCTCDCDCVLGDAKTNTARSRTGSNTSTYTNGYKRSTTNNRSDGRKKELYYSNR